MFDFLRRRIDYSTRFHMQRRLKSIDYRFLLAVIALAGAVAAVTLLA
jgi:hypothetical protein